MDEVRTTTEIDTEVKVEIKLETESLIMVQRKVGGSGLTNKALQKEPQKVNDSKTKDMLNGDPAEEKLEISEKTREEIKAEREAKKLAKQLAKKMKASAGESVMKPETTATNSQISSAIPTNPNTTVSTASEVNENVSERVNYFKF